MADTLRIAILGTGHMAQTMTAAIAQVPGLVVAGFISADPARARALGPGFANLEQALADPTVDALYIANRTAAHADAAQAALAAGKPVLCEKPCAINALEAQAIADTAARHGTLFMEAIATPFLPAVAAALGHAASGALGNLRQFSADFGYRTTRDTHPGCYAADGGGGVLLDRMIYPVALARLALGRVTKVDAHVIRDDDGIDLDAALLLAHAGGGTSLLSASLIAELGNRMTITGEGGTALVEAPLLSAETLVLTSAGSPARPAPASRLRQSPLARRLIRMARRPARRHLPYGASPYAPELIHFRDLVRAGATASPVLPPALSVEIADILDQARACDG